jgi:hypothetical protein
MLLRPQTLHINIAGYEVANVTTTKKTMMAGTMKPSPIFLLTYLNVA